MKYNETDLDNLLRFIVGVTLAVTLFSTIMTILYSLIFVTQPIGQSSPNDERFFELISPIATFLTGALSGIMLTNKKEKKKEDSE